MSAVQPRPEDKGGPRFIGCATDANLVEPTAVMLTSVDINGGVPDATILAACFDLSQEQKDVLRIGAGRLGARMRCIDIQPAMFHDVDPTNFTREYPPAVLGRLMLSDFIEGAGARLLTLDSDMIINTSLRPLFDLDLGTEYFAAVHDPPRLDDLNYFNSGMTLCDVATYKYHDVGRRCLRYIAEHRPHFPDQDALNAVVGDSWRRLDPLWNYFREMGRDFTAADYEVAKIAHFPGWKPWDYAHHPGHALYARHLREHRSKMDEAQTRWAMADYIATCYEVFLGRELESEQVVFERWRWPVKEIVQSVVTSNEFRDNVKRPIETDTPFPAELFKSSPTWRQRHWTSRLGNMSEETMRSVKSATTWRELIGALLKDQRWIAAVCLSAF